MNYTQAIEAAKSGKIVRCLSWNKESIAIWFNNSLCWKNGYAPIGKWTVFIGNPEIEGEWEIVSQ